MHDFRFHRQRDVIAAVFLPERGKNRQVKAVETATWQNFNRQDLHDLDGRQELKHEGALQPNSKFFHVNPVNPVYRFLRFADGLALSHRFVAIALRDGVED